MAMPLLRGAEVLGVFEVFSSRAAAFGERDERTLDALAQRVLKNLQRAAEPPAAPAQAATTAELPPEVSSASAPNVLPSPDVPAPAADEGSSGSRFEPVTWGLGVTVVACAVTLGCCSVGISAGRLAPELILRPRRPNQRSAHKVGPLK